MYWRTQPPNRDWAGTGDNDAPFDFHGADWRSFYGAGGQMENVEAVSRRFFWLCGERYPERLLGAQGWPLSRPNTVRPIVFFKQCNHVLCIVPHGMSL